jgi:multiple antibiotic resistance protein
MQASLNFLHLVFVGFVALFPPVNPIGTALIVDPLLRGLDSKFHYLRKHDFNR